MFRRRPFVIFAVTGLCAVAAATLQLWRPSYFIQTEVRIRDAIERNGRTAAPNPDLIFLAIDNESVTLDPDLDVKGLFASAKTAPASRGALQLMTKGWPWDREIYALLLERLISAGAKVVAFDCLFTEPAAGDDALRAALERFRDRVVIGSNFVTPEDVDLTRRFASRYDPPSATLLPPSDVADDRVGFTNFFAGENKVVRSAQFHVVFRDPDKSTAIYTSLAAQAAAKTGRAHLVPNDLAEHLIRFTGPPRTGFRPHSLFEIFVPEYWAHNYRSGELLRDKIVIVGAEGSWQKDELLTPFGPMPGAELHLNALNALLRGEFITEVSSLGTIIIVLVSAILGGILCLTIRSAWLRLSALVVTNAAAPFCAMWIYNHQSLLLPALAPLLALNATVLLGFVCDFAFERVEKLRLRSTLKTRDDLTQMIVHDLRSPLTIVTGYVGALQQMASSQLGESGAKCVNEALRGANDMRDMITTLLDVSRLEAGQMPLRRDKIDMCDLARRAAKNFEPILDRRTLRCDFAAESLPCECDADVVRRVLENLLSNAVKYTMSDGAIVIRVEPVDEDVKISVVDNGAGIPREQHKHIFEKFGQVDGGGEHRHSSGIGLAFCRMAVEAHGGRIGVTSEPGRGSTFFFTLPAQTHDRGASASDRSPLQRINIEA